jgi:hypothetical protein
LTIYNFDEMELQTVIAQIGMIDNTKNQDVTKKNLMFTEEVTKTTKENSSIAGTMYPAIMVASKDNWADQIRINCTRGAVECSSSEFPASLRQNMTMLSKLTTNAIRDVVVQVAEVLSGVVKGRIIDQMYNLMHCYTVAESQCREFKGPVRLEYTFPYALVLAAVVRFNDCTRVYYCIVPSPPIVSALADACYGTESLITNAYNDMMTSDLEMQALDYYFGLTDDKGEPLPFEEFNAFSICYATLAPGLTKVGYAVQIDIMNSLFGRNRWRDNYTARSKNIVAPVTHYDYLVSAYSRIIGNRSKGKTEEEWEVQQDLNDPDVKFGANNKATTMDETETKYSIPARPMSSISTREIHDILYWLSRLNKDENKRKICNIAALVVPTFTSYQAIVEHLTACFNHKPKTNQTVEMLFGLDSKERSRGKCLIKHHLMRPDLRNVEVMQYGYETMFFAGNRVYNIEAGESFATKYIGQQGQTALSRGTIFNPTCIIQLKLRDDKTSRMDSQMSYIPPDISVKIVIVELDRNDNSPKQTLINSLNEVFSNSNYVNSRFLLLCSNMLPSIIKKSVDGEGLKAYVKRSQSIYTPDNILFSALRSTLIYEISVAEEGEDNEGKKEDRTERKEKTEFIRRHRERVQGRVDNGQTGLSDWSMNRKQKEFVVSIVVVIILRVVIHKVKVIGLKRTKKIKNKTIRYLLQIGLNYIEHIYALIASAVTLVRLNS